jgi:hypothetical protein
MARRKGRAPRSPGQHAAPRCEGARGSGNGQWGSLRASERAGSDPGARFPAKGRIPLVGCFGGKEVAIGEETTTTRSLNRGEGKVGDFGEEGNRTDG